MNLSYTRIIYGILFFLITNFNVFAQIPLDSNFKPVFQREFSGRVLTILSQPDEKILFGGQFDFINSQLIGNLGRLNPDGTLDTSFKIGSGFDDRVETMALQSDGKILVAGQFTTYNNEPVDPLIRLNQDGTLDKTFSSIINFKFQFNGSIKKIMPLSDSSLILVGSFNLKKDGYRYGVVKINHDGSLNNEFQHVRSANIQEPGSWDLSISDVAILSDNKIIIGGNFSYIHTTPCSSLAKLNANGTLDEQFLSSGPYGSVDHLAVQPDGKIVITGNFSSYQNHRFNRIARINLNGDLDFSFDPSVGITGSSDFVNAIKVKKDGSILLGGSFNTYNGLNYHHICKLKPDGSIDPSFKFESSLADNDIVNDFIELRDNNLIIVGQLNLKKLDYNCLLKLKIDGSIDAGFHSKIKLATKASALNLKILNDGKIIASGQFNKVNHLERNKLVIFNVDGTIDSSFIPDVRLADFLNLNAIQEQADSKILIGGGYTKTGLYPLLRLNGDGTIDNTFKGLNDEFINFNAVHNIVLQPDNKILVAGDVKVDGDIFLKSIVVRLNSDGTLDNSFTQGTVSTNVEFAPAYTTTISLQKDGKILVGGVFTAYNGMGSLNLVRLNPDGSVDQTYSLEKTSYYSYINSKLQDDGNILIWGSGIVKYNNSAVSGIFRITPAGVLDKNFIPEVVEGSVKYVSLIEDNEIMVSGNFKDANGLHNLFVSFISNTGKLKSTINWTAKSSDYIESALYSKDKFIYLGGNFIQPNNERQLGLGRFIHPQSVALLTPTALTVNNITTTGLKLEWEGPSPEFRVLRKTTASSTSPKDGDVVYEGSAKTFTYTTKLTPNTAYFFTVYGKAAGEEYYSFKNKKIATSTAAPSEEKKSTVAFLAGETGMKTFPNAAADVTITQASTTDGYIQVTTAANPTSNANLPTGVKSIAADKYWQLAGIGLDPEAIKYTLSLNVAGISSVSDFNQVTILQRANANEVWVDLLASNNTVQKSYQDNKLTLTNLNTFPEIAFGVNNVTEISESVNSNFCLQQNHPNPFDKTTTIKYELKKQAEVVLDVINAQGRIVNRLVQQAQKPGTYQVQLDGKSLNSRSVYFIRLQTNGHKSVITAIYN